MSTRTADAQTMTTYFSGYIAGIMDYETAAEAQAASSKPCLNEATTVTSLILKTWDFQDLLKDENMINWKWFTEWYNLVKLICEIYGFLVTIDYSCDLTFYFFYITKNRMFNWDLWYADMIHNGWTLFMYFDIFIYGIIWKSRFDMAYSIGHFTKTLFELSLEEAVAAKATTPA